MVADLLFQVLIFIISLAVLAQSSHWVIKSAVKIARITKLGELMIGFVVLSLATTLPELAVSTSAILSSETAREFGIRIALGNIFDSNIVNIGFIFGLSAIITPLKISNKSLRKVITMLFLISLIPLLLLNMGYIGRFIGTLLLAAFVVFTYYSTKKKITIMGFHDYVPKKLIKKIKIPLQYHKSLFMLSLGIAGVLISSKFLIDSAVGIAGMLNIGGMVIGAVIIAVGTSLPELTNTLTSIKEGHMQLGLGNTIGSCLTNLTLVLGIVLIVGATIIETAIFYTVIMFVVVLSILLWYFLCVDRKIERNEGIVLFVTFVLFVITTLGIQISLLGIFTK